MHTEEPLGIIITTSGYGPGSIEFANSKPLYLIDGTGLLSICQEHDIQPESSASPGTSPNHQPARRLHIFSPNKISWHDAPSTAAANR